MFFHLLKYKLITIVKEREIAFWTMIFPLVLGTLFYFAFGNINHIAEDIDPIDIVVVDEVGIVEYFLEMEEKMSDEMAQAISGLDPAELEKVETVDQLQNVLSEAMESGWNPFSQEGAALDESVIQAPQVQGFIMLQMLYSLSEDGDNQLFHTYTAGMDKAKELLKNDEVKAIVSITREGPVLQFAGTGLDQTVVKTFFDQYQQTESMVMEIMQENDMQMDELAGLMEAANSQVTYLKETTLGKASLDNITYYFYALIAMACLYGVFVGMRNSIQLQANLSTLAARRSIAPAKKITSISADFLASVIFHWFCIGVLLVYLTLVLGIDLGDRYGLIIVTCMLGSMIGISFGQFVGAISGMKEEVKLGITLGATMLFCFLGDLMANGIKHNIEQSCPIINRLNPAVLISDSLYCLNIYDNYDKFTTQIITMGVMAGILLIGSALMLRRKKYACI